MGGVVQQNALHPEGVLSVACQMGGVAPLPPLASEKVCTAEH